MPTLFTATALNQALDGLITNSGGVWISLHTATPGTTGASELTGGSPAYARKQTTWGSAASGVKTGSAQTFDVGPAKTITHFGVWSAASGGTYVCGGPLRNAANTANISESWTEQGQFALTPRVTADDIPLT